jgi:hypothetical protein
MALLDLQAMDNPIVDLAHGSSNSGQSCHTSEASITLCDGPSGLSLLLCKHD